MIDDLTCEQVREIAPDLALGIADGQERGAALRHTATCADCRGLVSSFSSVADELLLVAPEREPPPGFASRTLARLDQRTSRSRRWVAPLAIAASLVLAMAVGAAAVLAGTADDRQLAESYRAVLAQGNGAFFAAAPVNGADGA